MRRMMPDTKPYAPACDRNRDPILAVLRERFAGCSRVLEIGSGTGQHAVHFAAAMPHLAWQTSERPEALPGLRMWLDEAALPNTPPPLALDVAAPWPGLAPVDAVFSANTLHIMSWPEVQALFARLPAVLAPPGVLVVYGPFRIGGRFTSDSNAAFDAALKDGAPHRGLRDFEAVSALAAQAGLEEAARIEMPANNFCGVWRLAAG
ncbi:DUF938 domain-containing protein [Caldimonas tepidiphila]|uniref:DUF938 domain-containing protein n=1 Tax=Caldimonas tepidiphila TaxID=2315841 RepID=UPI003AF3F157